MSVVLLLTGACSSAFSAEPVREVAVHFTRLATDSEVIAAGDYRLLLSQGGRTSAGWRVVDVVTHHAEVFDPPAAWECAFGGLGPTKILFNCQAGPGSTLVYDLAARSMRAFSTFSAGFFTSTIGTYWVAMGHATDPTNEHTTTSFEYGNLLTGQIVPDSRRIHGSTYVDLDSPQLVQTACAPITVPSELDANVAYVPGNLMFFGRVGVRVFATPDGQQVIGVQRCGSHHIQRFRTPDLVSNHRLLLWESRDGRGLRGISEPPGRPFAIRIPATVTRDPIEGVALDNHTIYITTDGRGDVWSAAIPPAVR